MWRRGLCDLQFGYEICPSMVFQGVVSDETKCDSQDDDNSNGSCYLNWIKLPGPPPIFHVLTKNFPQKCSTFVVCLCYTSITDLENSEFQILFSQHIQCVTDLKVRDVAAVMDKQVVAQGVVPSCCLEGLIYAPLENFNGIVLCSFNNVLVLNSRDMCALHSYNLFLELDNQAWSH